MTQEEKAKAYDEALERAKKWYNEEEPDSYTCIVESIFPELAESKDEKTRKELVALINDLILPDEQQSRFNTWLKKQGKQIVDCPQNHQDTGHPNGCIVMEDFNGGEGFYKLNLDYLNKKQVEEIQEMVRTWNANQDNDIIKECVGMALTDVPQSRFESYGTSLKKALAWLENQGKPILSNSPNIGKIDGFDAELNALLKKYEHLYKVDIIECLEFYINETKKKLEERQ